MVYFQSKLVIIGLIYTLIKSANALDCYRCDKNTCQEDITKWPIQSCGQTVPSAYWTVACLKQVYTDRITDEEATIRKCAIADKEPDDSLVLKCNDYEGPTVKCEVCADDLCNSATSVHFSFRILLGVVAVYLIHKFM